MLKRKNLFGFSITKQKGQLVIKLKRTKGLQRLLDTQGNNERTDIL